VVTYDAVIDVQNPKLKLRPGMTANITFVYAERADALLVPNAALRFRPSFADASAAPTDAASGSSGIVSKLMPRLPARGTRRAGTQISASREVWVLQDGKPVSVSVTPGASDGRMTEVQSDKLQPGMQVITEQAGGSAK